MNILDDSILNPDLPLLDKSWITPKLSKKPERHLANPKRIQWYGRRCLLKNPNFIGACIAGLVMVLTFIFWILSHRFLLTLLFGLLSPFVILTAFIGIICYFTKANREHWKKIAYLCRHPNTSQKMADLYQRGFIFTNWFVFLNPPPKIFKKFKHGEIPIHHYRPFNGYTPTSYEDLMDFIFPPERVLAVTERKNMQENLPGGGTQRQRTRL